MPDAATSAALRSGAGRHPRAWRSFADLAVPVAAPAGALLAVVTAAAVTDPDEIWVNRWPPDTATGEDESVVLPLPNRPPLEPQQ